MFGDINYRGWRKNMKHYLKDTGNLKNSMCELGMEGSTWDINVLDKNVNAFKSCYFEGGLSGEGCVMRQIPVSPITIQDIGNFDYL